MTLQAPKCTNCAEPMQRGLQTNAIGLCPSCWETKLRAEAVAVKARRALAEAE